MEFLKIFIKENPQISASIVTAICGIVGIFINIAINIRFRNRDYKDKNRVCQIEIMEAYYLPLLEKIEYFIDVVSKIECYGEDNISCFLSDKAGASYAQDVKLFAEGLEDLQEHFKKYKYQDDYKLFKIHRKVKKRVWTLYQSRKKCLEEADGISGKEIIQELKELSYRIQCYEIKILTDNFFIITKECLLKI